MLQEKRFLEYCTIRLDIKSFRYVVELGIPHVIELKLQVSLCESKDSFKSVLDYLELLAHAEVCKDFMTRRQ